MARKKKNKALPFIVIVALIAVLFVVYKVLSAQNTPAVDETVNNDVEMIIDRPVEEVSRVSYRILDEKELTFAFNSATGLWSLTDDTSYPLDQQTVQYMAAAICSIGVYRTLEGGDTGVYGFSDPLCTISVTYTDGAKYNYAIGDRNSNSGNYYFKDLDRGKVYTVSEQLIPYFSYTLEDLFVYETLPTDISTEYITSVTLAQGEKSSKTEDADKCAAAYELFTTLTPTQYADWHTDDATQKKYGMGESALTIAYKKSVTVSDASGNENKTRVASTYKVTFGKPTDDGYIPYSLGTSKVIYLADAKILTDLAAAIK